MRCLVRDDRNRGRKMAGPKRYCEDFSVGLTEERGDWLVTADEIIAFARLYDPQPFHLDAEAGAKTHFGGLVASGWHSCAMMMRMLVEHILHPETSLGSPGLDEVRWLKPVRPGDRLRLRATVMDNRPLQSRPGVGVVKVLCETLNQRDEAAVRVTANCLFLARPVAA
jgi:acyl dehydratase